MAIIKCPECQKDVSDVAKKCPGCGYAFVTQSQKPKSKSLLIKIACGILALFVIGALVGGEDSPSQSSAPKITKPDYIISADALVAEYESNEVAADNKYKRKTVRITARVEDIGKDIMDDPFIVFSDGNEFSMRGVQCFFKRSEVEKLANIRKGQLVTIQGKVDGLMMTVMIKNSIFID